MDIKKIALYIFISIISISIIYFIFLRPNSSSSTNINKNGNNCSHCDLDKTTCDPIIGKCIPKNLCNGKEKPDNACNYVCFKNEKWVCDTYPCLKSYLPDYIDCKIDELKCDNNNLYCQGVTGCNGGDRYYYDASKTSSCVCPPGFKGPECKFSKKDTCNSNGDVNDNGDCTCDQPYYGDNCEQTCGPTGMYVYDYVNEKCICGPSYELKGDTCILRDCYGNGTLNKDKCTCDGGYTGPNCETLICNKNQVYDKNCICRPDDITTTPYKRYHSPECTIYYCNLPSEYKDDGTCDCSKDEGSCGKYCQYTRSNSCNKKGTPNCNDKGSFTSCVCDDGWTGTNCNCEISKKPTTDDDKCKGISTICGPIGWDTHYSNCQDLYNSYTNQNEWSKSCIDQLFPDKFYKQKYKDNSTSTIGTLSCQDNTDNKADTSYICTDKICLHGQGCPSTPKKCPNGQVSICDLSTHYGWECKDQLSGDCDSASIGNVCKSGNPPTCFHCGTLNTTELVCMLDGGTPSIDCMNGLGIEKVIPINFPSGIYIDKSNGLPLYPTTSKKGCSNLFLKNSNTNPYSIQQNIDPKIYSNPVASYDSNSNTLTDFKTTDNRYFYPDLKNGKDARCILDQTDLITYLSNGKKDSILCSSSGTFIQNSDFFPILDSNNSPGYCACRSGFVGKNCEFSSYTCNDKGNPNYDGKCACNPGFAGDKCQFSDSKDCNNNGSVDNNGKCTCKQGYIGNNCKFSDNDCVKDFTPTEILGRRLVASLNGKASVDNNNLICDYSQTCTLTDDSQRDSCRLLIGAFKADDNNKDEVNFLIPIDGSINNNYMIIREFAFSFKNTDGFNGIIFSTKPLGFGIWNDNNYKINALKLYNVNITSYDYIGVPGTIKGIAGDEARALSYYMPLKGKNLENIYYQMVAVWKERTGKSKIILYIYLTMETNQGEWQ